MGVAICDYLHGKQQLVNIKFHDFVRLFPVVNILERNYNEGEAQKFGKI